MLNYYPDVLTIKELKEILAVGRNKAYALLESGTIRGFKLGRDWRVNKKDIINFLQREQRA